MKPIRRKGGSEGMGLSKMAAVSTNQMESVALCSAIYWQPGISDASKLRGIGKLLGFEAMSTAEPATQQNAEPTVQQQATPTRRRGRRSTTNNAGNAGTENSGAARGGRRSNRNWRQELTTFIE